MLKGKSLKITLGYEMKEEEAKNILAKNGMNFANYENEIDAYNDAAAILFNYGCGCDVEILGDL